MLLHVYFLIKHDKAIDLQGRATKAPLASHPMGLAQPLYTTVARWSALSDHG